MLVLFSLPKFLFGNSSSIPKELECSHLLPDHLLGMGVPEVQEAAVVLCLKALDGQTSMSQLCVLRGSPNLSGLSVLSQEKGRLVAPTS